MAVVNNKKLISEDHRIMKLLKNSDNSTLFNAYRDAINEVGKYRTAIIFPEQMFLSSTIYEVCVEVDDKKVDITFAQHDNVKVVSILNHVKVLTLNEIIDGKFEIDTLRFLIKKSPKFVFAQTCGSNGSKVCWYYFTNKREALAYAKSKMVI